MLRIAVAIATSAGVGFLPFAPGTFGSLVGLALWWVLPASPPVHLVVIMLLFALGWWSATICERHFARTDPSQVVIDEVLGMMVTLFLSPVTAVAAVLGFLLFRLFDIMKPYPANRIEHVQGGLGVMGDDAVAGVYANIALQAALAAAGWFFGASAP